MKGLEKVIQESFSSSLPVLMKIEMATQIYVKYTVVKFYENPLSRRCVLCMQVDDDKGSRCFL
jgi:hypothetical protein